MEGAAVPADLEPILNISGAPRLVGSPVFMGKGDCRRVARSTRPLGPKLLSKVETSCLAVRAFMSCPRKLRGAVPKTFKR